MMQFLNIEHCKILMFFLNLMVKARFGEHFILRKNFWFISLFTSLLLSLPDDLDSVYLKVLKYIQVLRVDKTPRNFF